MATGTFAMSAGIANAQATQPAETPGVQAPAATAAEGEQIIVTGSRIARPNLEQASPVNVIGQEEIELAQPTSVEQLLRDLPGTAPGIGAQVNNGTNGTASFNLRNLGSNRNLVLLNGRRVIPSTLGGAVDLNIIPLALIQRADILTGGASTTYGADAVAGVVNFITRRDFTGVEVNANYGVTGRGDGQNYRIDLTTGASLDDGRGNVVLGLSYTNVSPVLQGDRPIGQFARQSTRCTAAQIANPAPFGGFCDPNLNNTVVGFRQGSGTATPSSLFFPLPTTGPLAGGARVDPATGSFIAGLSDYNFNPINLFQTPLDRWSIYAQSRYEVNPSLEFYSEAFYARSQVRQEIAPTGTFTNVFQLPLNNQFLTATQRSQLCTFAGVADCAAAQASGQEIPVIVARRFTEAGPRVTEYISNVFQVTAGVRGAITDGLSYDLFAQYGEANRRNTSTGTALQSRVQQALRNCPTGSAPGCAPINLFGADGSISQAALTFVGVPVTAFINTKYSSVQGSVAGDVGVSSPFATDGIGIAVGAEYRRYSGGQFGDLPSSTAGEVLGAGGAVTTVNGEYDTREIFGEIDIPLIQDRPFFHDLTVNAGIRYSDYSTSGTNTTWNVRGSWSPVPDIKFRAAYARATRAPNLGELFAPQNTILNNLAVDPCQGANATANATIQAICLAQLNAVGAGSRLGSVPVPVAGQINITTGGNPNLDPETATTITAGVVLQPSFVPGFTATVDWFDIKVRGAITSPTVGDILNGCFGQTNAADPRCQLILRNPLTGGLSGDPSTTRGVILASSNLGFIQTRGVDFGLGYVTNITDEARLNLSFNGNYTSRSRFQATPSGFIRECVGFYSVSCDPVLPKWSWNARATLSLSAVDLSLLWRHIDSTSYEPRTGANATTPPTAGTVGSFGSTNPATIVDNYLRIPAFNTFDLSTRFNVSERLRLTFVVENLLDKSPPDVGNTIGSTSYNSGNTYPSTYDTLGRRFTVAANLRF